MSNREVALYAVRTFVGVVIILFLVYMLAESASVANTATNLYRVTILTGEEKREEVLEQSELGAEAFRAVMVHLYVEDPGLQETALIKVEQATVDQRFYGQAVTGWQMVYPYSEQ